MNWKTKIFRIRKSGTWNPTIPKIIKPAEKSLSPNYVFVLFQLLNVLLNCNASLGLIVKDKLDKLWLLWKYKRKRERETKNKREKRDRDREYKRNAEICREKAHKKTNWKKKQRQVCLREREKKNC